jgi:putative addiction module component (TIGR02574 family)
MSIDTLTQAALSLPIEERAALAARIVNSIDNNDAELSSAWLLVAERRRQDVLSGKAKTMSAEEASARVRARVVI